MSETDLDSSPEQQYFQALEKVFVELRGAPLLLSPSDWQVARRWYREEIPLEVVETAIRQLFASREERGAKGKVQSLRYCASAVERAWEEIRQLTAAGHAAERPALETEPRLANLAAALPEGLPQRERWAAAITALEGGAEEVERELARLDGELIGSLDEGLDDQERQRLADEVAASLAHLQDRLGADELAVAEKRLLRQSLRSALGLPVLSLFSPEAE